MEAPIPTLREAPVEAAPAVEERKIFRVNLKGSFFAKICFPDVFFSKSRKVFFSKPCREISDFQKCFEGSGYSDRGTGYKSSPATWGGHVIIIMSQRERHPILRFGVYPGSPRPNKEWSLG